jgi:hypothetical protein
LAAKRKNEGRKPGRPSAASSRGPQRRPPQPKIVRKAERPNSGRLKASRVPPTDSGAARSKKRRLSYDQVELEKLPLASNFDKDPDIKDIILVIREFKRHPQFCDLLTQLIEAEHGERSAVEGDVVDRRVARGRPRLKGNRALLYLAYVLSGYSGMWTFYDRLKSTGIFEECGFEKVPTYNAMRLWFVELEEGVDAFKTVAQGLIRQAKRHEPRIGRFIMVDSTAWQTNAALRHFPEHLCPACISDSEAEAQRQRRAKEQGKQTPRPVKRRRSKFLKRATGDRVDEARHKENQIEDPLEGDPIRPGSSMSSLGIDEHGRQIFQIDGHLFSARDLTSGLRSYKEIGGWYGGYGQAGIDMLVGSPIALDAFRADEQEYDFYPATFEDVVAATGEAPLAVSVDAGFTIRSFFEFNTRRNVAVVGPRRKRTGKMEDADWRTDAYDEHGVPRCPGCGGPGMKIQWTAGGKEGPRLRFGCAAPFPENAYCEGVHSIACSSEWGLLTALPHTHPLYQALLKERGNYEHVFRHFRERYCFAAKDFTGRLKRPGLSAQRLRAQAALLLEWFRLCLRNGWLGSWKRRNDSKPVAVSDNGGLAYLLAVRRKAKLDFPYGSYWKRLQIRKKAKPPDPEPGDDGPPPQRR